MIASSRRARRVTRWALALTAVSLRLWQVATEDAYLHPDALFQGLEPAFRAVHGYGVVAWEFKQGLRSWTWPGLLSAPFALCHWLDLSGPGVGMATAVALARSLVVAIDLAALALAVQLARREAGHWAAVAVLALGASHPMFVVMAAQPLIDVPASALLLALAHRGLSVGLGPPVLTLRETPESPVIAPTLHGETAAPPLLLPVAQPEAPGGAERVGLTPRDLAIVGALAALTALVRVQLTPAVALVALLALRRSPADARRAGVRAFALGGVAVVALWGAVDWVTWGAPLHSVAAYLRYNLQAGQTAFGVMPADRYWAHFGEAAPGLRWLLLPLALVGARRAPSLGLLAAAVLLPHQLVPYKVWRFVHPGLWLVVTLAAIGAVHAAAVASELAKQRTGPSAGVARGARLWAAALTLSALVAVPWSWRDGGVWRTTWLHHQGGDDAVVRSRGINRAYLAAGQTRDLRQLVQAVLPEAAAPGLALLGHPARVLHPVGARAGPGALAGSDAWVIPDGPGRTLLPGAPRVFRDPASGVALVRTRRGDPDAHAPRAPPSVESGP